MSGLQYKSQASLFFLRPMVQVAIVVRHTTRLCFLAVRPQTYRNNAAIARCSALHHPAFENFNTAYGASLLWRASHFTLSGSYTGVHATRNPARALCDRAGDSSDPHMRPRPDRWKSWHMIHVDGTLAVAFSPPWQSRHEAKGGNSTSALLSDIVVL